MVAKELRRHHRKWPYLASGLLLTLLLIARIYLGLDWLSGALVGFILGLAWTAIVGMAYRARALRSFDGSMASIIFYGTLVLTLSWQINVHLEEDLAAVRIPLDERIIPADEWWTESWAQLPAERTRAPASQARAFNLQVGGRPDVLAGVLAREGWEPVAPASWRWFLQSLNPEADERTLPLTGRNFLGQGEALVMRHGGAEGGEQWVVRLWDSGGRLGPTAVPLYLGQFTLERLDQRLWLFSHWRPAYPSKEALERLARIMEAAGAETRYATSDLLLIRHLPLPESEAGNPAASAGASPDR
jgi:undecaprenyl-diphosphatase